MAVKIAGRSDVCLSGYTTRTEYSRIMGLAPSERQKPPILGIPVCGGDTLPPTSFGAMGL